jgi:hypothetical protein
MLYRNLFLKCGFAVFALTAAFASAAHAKCSGSYSFELGTYDNGEDLDACFQWVQDVRGDRAEWPEERSSWIWIKDLDEAKSWADRALRSNHHFSYKRGLSPEALALCQRTFAPDTILTVKSVLVVGHDEFDKKCVAYQVSRGIFSWRVFSYGPSDLDDGTGYFGGIAPGGAE